MYTQDVIKEILDKYVDDSDDDQVSNAELSRLISIALAANTPRPLAEWYEDIGPVLWWSFPVREAPWVGTPLDQGAPMSVRIGTQEFAVVAGEIGAWPGYHTHWTPLPPAPVEPPGEDHR